MQVLMLPLSKVNGWIGTLRELTPLREPNSSHSIGMTALTVAPTWIHADPSDAIEKNIVKIVGTILHARSRRLTREDRLRNMSIWYGMYVLYEDLEEPCFLLANTMACI